MNQVNLYGKIDRIEYAAILQSELSNSIEQGTVSEEFQTNLWNYIVENKVELGKDLGKDATTTTLQQSGLALLQKSMEKSDDAVIMKGPEGDKQWAIVDNDKVETAGNKIEKQ